jgi:DNA-binding NarL/FixJ family response regulator
MRVILADHHVHARVALEALIDEESQLELVGEAMDAQALLVLIEKHKPDLVLVDEQLPGIPIEELIVSLHAHQPVPTVIVMSSDPTCSRKILDAGVDIFVSKVDRPDRLIQSLHKYLQRYDG